jgi:hypothetical protein
MLSEFTKAKSDREKQREMAGVQTREEKVTQRGRGL